MTWARIGCMIAVTSLLLFICLVIAGFRAPSELAESVALLFVVGMALMVLGS